MLKPIGNDKNILGPKLGNFDFNGILVIVFFLEKH